MSESPETVVLALRERVEKLTAELATAALDAAAMQRLHQVEADNLRRAVDSRDVIGQAKGLLMCNRRMNGDAAFALLKAQSQHQNVKLVQIASELVARHERMVTRYVHDSTVRD